MTKELNRFKGQTAEQLSEMSDREYHELNMLEKVEYCVIVNGLMNHDEYRKIEAADIYATGADTTSITLYGTKKGCRKTSIGYRFLVDEIHDRYKLVETNEF